MRLNFRPQIYEDESLGGYVHRLANANGFDSVTAFADGLGIRRQKLDNHVFTPSAIEILSEMTDISESELLRHSAAEYEKVSFMNGLLKNRFRYCSLCAKEKLYHRQLWILRPLTACLKHKVHLNSKCHNCDTNISLTSLVTGHCNKCYADLLTVSPTVIDEQLEQYEFERSFVNKLNGKNTDCIGNLSIEKYMLLATGSFHLLEGLDSFLGTGQKISLFHQKRDCRLENIEYGNFHWMFKNFPHNFFVVLEKFNEKHSDIRYLQKMNFEKVLMDKAFEKIKQAYLFFWTRKLDHGEIRRDFSVFKMNERLLVEREFVTQDELKNKSKLTYQAIKRIVKKEQIKVNEKTYGKIKRREIHKKTFDKAAKIRSGFIPRREAANMLGISLESLKGLMEAGYLKINYDYFKYGLIDSRQIKALLKRFAGEYGAELSDAVTFGHALIKYSVCGLKIVDLFEFIKKGYLVPFNSMENGNLASSAYGKKQLAQCVQMLKRQKQKMEGYYMSDVIRRLRIGEKSMIRLMDMKMLIPEKIVVHRNGKKHYLFSKMQIDAFAKNYCTIEEAAKRFKIPNSRIRKWFYQGRLQDVAQGHCRSYLFKTIEIKKLINSQLKEPS